MVLHCGWHVPKTKGTILFLLAVGVSILGAVLLHACLSLDGEQELYSEAVPLDWLCFQDGSRRWLVVA